MYRVGLKVLNIKGLTRDKSQRTHYHEKSAMVYYPLLEGNTLKNNTLQKSRSKCNILYKSYIF